MTRGRILAVTGTLVAVGVLTCYFFVNPATSTWVPKCVFRQLTGLDCPGCGSQRMIHALLHGDFTSAWRANAFILCTAPLLALMLWSAAFRDRMPRLYRSLNSPIMTVVITSALLAWTILRNIPI